MVQRPSVRSGDGVKRSVKMRTTKGKTDIRATKYRVGREQRQDTN